MGKKKEKQRAKELEAAAKAGLPNRPSQPTASSSVVRNEPPPPSISSSQLQYTRDIARIYWSNGTYDFRLGEPSNGAPPIIPATSLPSSSSSHHEDRPHKRPRRDSPPPETRDHRGSSPRRFDRRSTSRSPTPEFTPGLPSDEYIQISLQPSSLISSDDTSTPSNPKLLILDLNGTLVYRSPRNHGGNRTITPRPYMRPFTQWATDPRSGLETMIWSSAMPFNVQKMARVCFGEDGVEKLRAIWARDTLGLSKRDYERKVQTVKDLNLIWQKLPFSVLDTILLDDSALKAHLQPYNHLVLTEYDAQMMRIDRQYLSPPDGPPDPAPDLIATDTPTGGAHDQTLLAVIGILADAVKQTNVAAWMRGGGLWHTREPPNSKSLDVPPSSSPAIEAPSLGNPSSSPVRGKRKRESTPFADDAVEEGVVRFDQGTDAPPPPPLPRLWFEDHVVFREWVARGRRELERLDIPAIHGLKATAPGTLSVQDAAPPHQT